MKRGVVSDRVCPFVFAAAPFSMKALAAALLSDAHYALRHSDHGEDSGDVWKIFVIFIPSHLRVFVVRPLMSLPLFFLFPRFYQQGKPPLLKHFTTWISQKQPPDAVSCSMQFLILWQAEIAQQPVFLWAWSPCERWGDCTLFYLTSIFSSLENFQSHSQQPLICVHELELVSSVILADG